MNKRNIKLILGAIASSICVNSPAQAKLPLLPSFEPVALTYPAIRDHLDQLPAIIKSKVNKKVNETFDRDGDGIVSTDEEKKALVNYYREFDKNEDGQLQPREFKSAMDNLRKNGKNAKE